MTHSSDDDLRDRLRAADPAAQLPPADPAEVDRVIAEQLAGFLPRP